MGPTLTKYMVTMIISFPKVFRVAVKFLESPTVAVALTAFLGGVVAKKRTGGAPALCGLINGMLLMGVMILLSFFFLSESSSYSALISTLLHAAVLILSVLGALAGSPKPKSAMRSRRRKY